MSFVYTKGGSKRQGAIRRPGRSVTFVGKSWKGLEAGRGLGAGPQYESIGPSVYSKPGWGKSDKSENIFTICANVWIIFITFAHDSIETVADEFT